MIAKAALTAGKIVADSQRTAQPPGGNTSIPKLNLSQAKKPKKETNEDLKGQTPDPQKPEGKGPKPKWKDPRADRYGNPYG